MDLQLRAKIALVTGSTAGIGLEIARKLATEHADVIIAGRDQAKLDRAVASLRASGGTTVRTEIWAKNFGLESRITPTEAGAGTSAEGLLRWPNLRRRVA